MRISTFAIIGLAFSAVTAFPNDCAAQGSFAGISDRLGLKAGAGITSWTRTPESPLVELKQTIGAVFGVFVVPKPRAPIGFQIEALLAIKRARQVYSGSIVSTTSYSRRYLDVPILLRVASTSPGMQGYLVVGPSLGLLLSSGQHTEPESHTPFIEVPMNPLDIGLAIGIGGKTARYTVEGRYTASLRAAGEYHAENGTVKNRALMLSLGFFIH